MTSTYHCLDTCQVSDLSYDRVHHLMFRFSAPGESPLPPQRNTRGTASDIRRDVISEVQNIRRDVVFEVQTAVSDIRHTLKYQEVADGQHQSVSVIHLPSVAEYTLTIA